MIDLTQRVGLPVFFDPRTLDIKFWEGISWLNEWSKTLSKNSLWKSLKLASEITDKEGRVTGDVNLWKYKDPNAVLYRGFQGMFWEGKLDELVEKHRIRPDITALHAGSLDGEFIRTEGHEHLSGFPEIYETVYGKNGYLLFKTAEDREDIEDVMFVVAEAGDHVLFPPGYQHITVNLGREGFLMTDWVSPEAKTDFKYIKQHNGSPYWVVQGSHGFDFIKNPKYKGDVPEIRVVRPRLEVPELGIKRGEPMFNLVKDGKVDMLKFLNDPADRAFY